ncbi:MAG: T9SS type A sorting domain-containing protein [bacterium]|nr:T9SS type A sorting domain-containing protein [bacterium]
MIRHIGFLFLFVFACNVFASPTNRGYSGAPGSLGRCSSSCHGVNQGTVQITGFPTEYVPDSTYLIAIEAVSGLPIKNFNGSVRRGTGSVNAGTITAGFNTVTYSVTQETNGIRLTPNDRQNGNFNWRAPTAGAGTVRLYVAAHQGDRNTGPNSTISLTATEAVIPQPPDAPSDPVPAMAATGVATNTSLSWSVVPDAIGYDVYFGNENPPPLVQSATSENTYPLPGLQPGTQYYWQVYAFNDNGSTPSAIWSFTTMTAPDPCTNPSPANGAENVLIGAGLSWNPASGAETYEVFLGTTEPLGTVGTTTETVFSPATQFEVGTTYLWRVESTNSAGTTVGQTWSFTTEAESGADDSPVVRGFQLSSAYPNPFNSNVRVNLSIPQAGMTSVTVYDISGREVATLVNGTLSAGEHLLEWNALGNAAGIYLMRCLCAGVTSSQKLVYLP